MPRKKATDTREAKTIKREQRQREIRTAKKGAAADAIGTIGKTSEIYILTFGQFSLIDTLVHLLDRTGPAAVDIATWTAANAHLEESANLLKSAAITRMRWVVDTSFLNRQPAYCRRMRELFGDDCIRTCRTHSKFINITNDEWDVTVRTSMNLNNNPRLENLEISNDPALSGFLTEIVDGIFGEHTAGDFQADLPGLDDMENVHVPGLLNYPKATAATMQTKPKRPTMGKPA